MNEDLYNELSGFMVTLDNQKVIKVEDWNKVHEELVKFVEMWEDY